MIDSLEEGNVKYSTWKRVEIGDGEKRMNLVMVEIPKEEFKLIFKHECHILVLQTKNMSSLPRKRPVKYKWVDI
jgi:hypothetical protein